MPAHKLPAKAKILILQRLAMGDTPTGIVREVQEQFGITISRQNIRNYDPLQNDNLAPHWCEVYHMTRRMMNVKWQLDPIDNRAYRQRLRRQLVEKNLNNPRLVRQIIVDAAMDEGGMFVPDRRRPLPRR